MRSFGQNQREDEVRTHVDLFSGIGGFSLAASWAGFETVAFVEQNKFCQQVLGKHWPSVPIISDIREVTAERLTREGINVSEIKLISGGFPCQPFSNAGKRKGTDDDRYLWPEMLRVIREVQPTYIVGENVYGLVSNQGGLVLEGIYSDLASAGYEIIPPIVFPAAAVNAKHRRDRVWICAHSRHDDRSTEQGQQQEKRPEVFDRSSSQAVTLAHSDVERLQGSATGGQVQRRQAATGYGGQDGTDLRHPTSEGFPQWAGGTMEQPWPLTEFERSDGDGKEREIERNFRGVAYGVSRRVDRLRCLGNAIVPQVAYQLIKRMIEAEQCHS